MTTESAISFRLARRLMDYQRLPDQSIMRTGEDLTGVIAFIVGADGRWSFQLWRVLGRGDLACPLKLLL
jgi:hypothetical protein